MSTQFTSFQIFIWARFYNYFELELSWLNSRLCFSISTLWSPFSKEEANKLTGNKAYWSGFSGVWCFGEFQICFAFRKLKKINCGTCVCSEGWIQFYCQNKIQTFQLKLLLPFKWTQDRKFVQSFSLCWPAKTYSEMSDPGVSSFRGPNKQIIEIETNIRGF